MSGYEVGAALAAFEAGIGDVNSDAKGSGARFNAGKTPYEFLPLDLLLEMVECASAIEWPGGGTASNILLALALWQKRELSISEVITLASNNAASIAAFAPAAEVFKHVTERQVKPYPMWNWAKGMKWSVPYGCAIRHLMAEDEGQENDPETGLPHQGHTLCNLIMLLQYSKTYTEGDDRPMKGLL